MAKGGGFFENIVAAGVGAYAAKNASNARGLAFNLGQSILVVIAILLAVGVLARIITRFREGFVPTFPSKEGNKKDVTPAGNVILY
jgi:hypothetical protein